MIPHLPERPVASLSDQLRRIWRAPRPDPVPAGEEWRMPDATSYAAGWLLASAIVGARYRASAIDALPLFDPTRGWDRFVLTRRVSCARCAAEAATAFGQLRLDRDGAVSFTTPHGSPLITFDPVTPAALPGQLGDLWTGLPPVAVPAGDHAACPHTRAVHYPLVYRVVADLIVAYPGLVAAREIVVDDTQEAGMYHPLWSQMGGQTGLTYDWFGLRYAPTGATAFLRGNGQQGVHRTARGTWAITFTGAAVVTAALLATQVRDWLGLDGVG